MAKAKKLPSGQWRTLVYSHTDKDGRRHYESFTADTKKESEYLAADFSITRKKKRRDSLSVGEAVQKYISARQSVLSPSTVRVYGIYLKNDFNLIKDLKIDDITQEQIQIWIGDISIQKSGTKRNPKTIRNIYGLLSATLDMFLPGKYFNVKLPEKEKKNLYVPSDADIKKILDYSNGKEIELAILLAAFGPMRRGEICALTSDDVNGNFITVNKDMVLDANNHWIIKPPKTYSSNRTLEFPPFVIDKLKGIEGRIIKATPTQLTNRFRRLIKFSGVENTFRFHDLRHYSASIMHAIGIPDQYIMQRGGWATDSVMKTVYRGTISEETKKMNNKIINHFGNII